jgi:hypothetical protein
VELGFTESGITKKGRKSSAWTCGRTVSGRMEMEALLGAGGSSEAPSAAGALGRAGLEGEGATATAALTTAAGESAGGGEEGSGGAAADDPTATVSGSGSLKRRPGGPSDGR